MKDQPLAGVQPQLEQLQENLVNTVPVPIEDRCVVFTDEDLAARNEDVMLVLPEENIVSDEEEIFEPEQAEPNEDAYVAEFTVEEGAVAVIPLDNVEFGIPTNTRPR